MTLLKHFALLSKAISEDESPTPGYLFVEVAKITNEGLSSCRELEDYLIKKLQKNNPIVKTKALQVIKHVCEHGHAEFRRDLQRKNDAIKACVSFKGSPDPLKGDNLNQAVRDAAREAMAAVFGSETSEERKTTQRNMVGFGSDSVNAGGAGYNMGGASGSGQFDSAAAERERAYNQSMGRSPVVDEGSNDRKVSSTGMVGFGNPNFQSKPKSTFGSNLVSAITSRIPGSKKNTAGPVMNAGPPPSAYGAPTVPPPSYSANSESYFNQPRKTAVGGSPAPVAQSAEPGEYEARIVEEICAFSGVRPAPTREQLQKFVSQCQSLDREVMCSLIIDKFDSPQWQVRLRALHVIEALAQHGNSAYVDELRQYTEAISTQLDTVQASVKERAQRVLSLLDPDTYGHLAAEGGAETSSASAMAAANAKKNKTVIRSKYDGSEPIETSHPQPSRGGGGGGNNLLDFGDAPAAAHSAPMGDGGGDLFGGLSIKPQQQQQQQQQFHAQQSHQQHHFQQQQQQQHHHQQQQRQQHQQPPQQQQQQQQQDASGFGFSFIDSGSSQAPEPVHHHPHQGGNPNAAASAQQPRGRASSGMGGFFGPGAPLGGPAMGGAVPAPAGNDSFDPIASGDYVARDRTNSGGWAGMHMTPQQMQMQQMLQQQQQQQMMMMMMSGGMMNPAAMGMNPAAMQGGMNNMMFPMMYGGGGMGGPGAGGIGAVPQAAPNQASSDSFSFISNKQQDSFDFVADQMKANK